jgi:hypothetical protein
VRSLAASWFPGINSGMDVNPVAVDVHQRQISDPLQVCLGTTIVEISAPSPNSR